jgi:hypothetical protein
MVFQLNLSEHQDWTWKTSGSRKSCSKQSSGCNSKWHASTPTESVWAQWPKSSPQCHYKYLCHHRICSFCIHSQVRAEEYSNRVRSQHQYNDSLWQCHHVLINEKASQCLQIIVAFSPPPISRLQSMSYLWFQIYIFICFWGHCILACRPNIFYGSENLGQSW